MDVTVIIVSYNTKDLTLACLASVFEETRAAELEVIVVDNASRDGSADAIARTHPSAELVALEENRGFAAANNLASERARGRYLLLLNPDTVVLDGAIDEVVRFADAHPEYGIVGGRTFFEDGALNPTSCWGRPTPWSVACRSLALSVAFPRNRFVDPETYGDWARDTVREVDIVTGCFLLIRRELWNELSGFDTSFFMYGEDADLCLRARARGHRCVLDPEARLVHHGGRSEPVAADKTIRLMRAEAQLYRRHWSGPWTALVPSLLRTAVLVRLVLWSLAGWLGGRESRAKVEKFREVWRRRPEWLAP